MLRYPPSSIYRYLDLPSIQRIQTHNKHKLNTTWPKPTTALYFEYHRTRLKQVTFTRQNAWTTCITHMRTHRNFTSPDPTPALPSPSHLCTLTFSQHTYMHHKRQYMYHSHHNNRTHNIGYHDNLTDRPRTTTGLGNTTTSTQIQQ